MYNQTKLLESKFIKLLINQQRFYSPELTNFQHTPVLVKEAVHYLNAAHNKKFIDMTFGCGGHTRAILEKVPGATVYALDRDPSAYECAAKLSKEYPGQIIPLLGKFSDLSIKFRMDGIKQGTFDGILFDFGCSSIQIDKPLRGFSFLRNGSLDMRMSMQNDPITAFDVLSKIDENDLARIIRVYGDELAAKKIARAVVESRSGFSKVKDTKKLAELVSFCISRSCKIDALQRTSHLATKTFQAIRIFINNELNEINYGMLFAQKYLRKGGRLVAITFHSLEDTIVKRHIKGNIVEGIPNPVPLKYSAHDLIYDKREISSLSRKRWKPLNKHVIMCTQNEVLTNPRCRSAKLRAAEKL